MRADIIRTKIREIEESLKLVENNMPESFEKFSNLGLVKDGMYKRLEFCIENVFNICAIVNTDLELGNLDAGTYFYSLIINGRNAGSKKLVLVN